MLTAEVLNRVFLARFGAATFTCFVIEDAGMQYFVTAKHCVADMSDIDSIEIMRHGHYQEHRVRLIGHAEPGIDVSVFACDTMGRNAVGAVGFGTSGIVFTQDVYFLGFPYGYSFRLEGLNEGLPFPLVKKAILSSMSTPDIPFMYLDGINNAGFSGGPMVFLAHETRSWSIGGVISGYERDETDGNTGLIHAYDLLRALELVRVKPEGRPYAPS